MKLTVTRVNLPLKHPFTIAHRTTATQAGVRVELKHNGVGGDGEMIL